MGGPATCFNAHKHWILGWFKDRSLALTTNDLPWTGELAAFADYDVTPSSQYTIIRIGQSGPARLFLQYNLAKKMNRGARAFKNMVVVTEDEGSNPGYQSWAVGSINVDLNGSLKYSGLYDLDHDLVIEVCEKGSGPTDFVRLSVYVDDGKQQSGCSKLPKSSGEECVDSAADVFVEQKGVYRNCGWLSRNFDKWGPVLCVPGQEAHALCPATCGTCSLQSCMDSSDTFYANSNNGYQDCTWLAKREARIDRFCYEGHEAYETCPATCNSCS